MCVYSVYIHNVYTQSSEEDGYTSNANIYMCVYLSKHSVYIHSANANIYMCVYLSKHSVYIHSANANIYMYI